MIAYENVEFEGISMPEHIRKGLINLLTIPVGTVALDRDFGLDISFLDMPLPHAKQAYTIEVTKKMKSKEPRKYHEMPHPLGLNGGIFEITDPPVIDEKTGETGLPGEAINCKCVMELVYEV